jgi:signal transduction histidine kinase
LRPSQANLLTKASASSATSRQPSSIVRAWPQVGSLDDLRHGVVSLLPIAVEWTPTERPPAEIETAVYCVVPEGLASALKHSEASGIAITVDKVEPELAANGRRLRKAVRAAITDDGIGGTPGL